MINYKGTPVIGEDSNPQHTSEFFAIAGTVLFWIIFSIFSFVIKPLPEKPKYKEVQIVLSSTPVVQKTEEAPAPAEAASASAASSETVVEQVVETPVAEAPAPKVETPPVVKETPPAPKPSNTQKQPAKQNPPNDPPKKAPAKSVDKPNVKPIEESDNTVYSTDLTNGFDFNSIRKTNRNNDDIWASMDNEVSNSNTANGIPIKVNNETSIESNPDAVVNNSNIGPIKSNDQNPKKGNGEVTQKDNYDAIRNAESRDRGDATSDGGKSTTPSTGKDKDAVTWADASGARTQYNFDTELSLAAKRSMLITKPIQFKITFSVDTNGNVIASTITIKNEVMLTDIIKNEMKQKISSWKFSSGKQISIAEFIWTLAPLN